MPRTSPLMKSVALAAALSLALGSLAEARPGGGRSFGSRGANSWSSPPVTNTAPRTAQPLPGPGYSSAPRAPMGASAPQRRFGGGLLGGLAAGFIGAGLLGMLTGHGFMGGLGSLFSFLGLLLQIGLVVLVVRWAIGWFRNRQQPAAAGAPGPGYASQGYAPQGQGYARQGYAPQAEAQPQWMGAGGGAGMDAPRPGPTTPLQIADADFNRFEEILGEIQTAYGRGDRATLSRLATPEIANIFLGQLDDDARRGVANKVTSPKLLQGDLSEAWSEPGAEYATVAMRFSIIDAIIDKASGRVVEGDTMHPTEATEIWTFMRAPGSGQAGWTLSAIQQA